MTDSGESGNTGLLSDEAFAEEIPDDIQRVGIGEHSIDTAPAEMATYGLGSCIAIVLYHKPTQTGGLVHVMLPKEETIKGEKSEWRFADTGTINLIENLEEATQSSHSEFVAKIVGGSQMFPFDNFGSNIGERNIESAKETLEKCNIPIVGEDVGGDFGRSVVFSLDSGDVSVTTATEEINKL